MLKCKKHRVSVLLASFFVTLVIAGSASAQNFQAKSASVPAAQSVSISAAARSQAMPQEELDSKEANLRQHYLEGPLAEVSAAARAAAQPPTVQATTILDVPGPISLITNRPLTDTETNNATSTVGEPSVAVRGSEILYTGNWYASVSGDGGTTFSYVNPATSFPPIPGQTFCCDQVALYDPKHDLMIWFLQYMNDGTNNTVRVAVSQGNDIPAQQWRFYDFTPLSVGGWNNEWFDYPELVVSDEFLYVTINTFTTQTDSFTRAVILRLPLNEMANYQGFNYNYFASNRDYDFSFRPTHGAVGTMYFGCHVSTNTLRIYTWPENSTTISSDDVAVDVWSSGTRVAPGPDGRDWLGRADSRITAAWASGNDIGFGWTAAQDNNYSYPHVRFAIMNKNTKAITVQPHLWHSQFAFAYPATAPNSSGVVGLSVSYGGGSYYPSHAVGIFNISNSLWNLIQTKKGTHGPSSNRWGDYLSIRPHGTDPETWVASGFTLQGGTLRTNIVPIYVHFGQDDLPDVSFENLEANNRLSRGETLIVEATVKRNGVLSPGETVMFTSVNTSLASIKSPASVVTDGNGVAVATVEGETRTRTTTTINAKVDGVTKSVSVKVPDLSAIGLLFLMTGILLFDAFGKRSRSL